MKEDWNIYVENGFEDREAYLQFLADQYGISTFEISMIAEMLGPEEDFDGLPMALDDYYDRRSFFPIDHTIVNTGTR